MQINLLYEEGKLPPEIVNQNFIIKRIMKESKLQFSWRYQRQNSLSSPSFNLTVASVYGVIRNEFNESLNSIGYIIIIFFTSFNRTMKSRGKEILLEMCFFFFLVKFFPLLYCPFKCVSVHCKGNERKLLPTWKDKFLPFFVQKAQKSF